MRIIYLGILTLNDRMRESELFIHEIAVIENNYNERITQTYPITSHRIFLFIKKNTKCSAIEYSYHF